MARILVAWTLASAASGPFRTLALDIGECNRALGMESGAIPDKAISASTSYNVDSVGPHNARLLKESNGGAWCPSNQIDKTAKEYLEVSLGSMHVLTQVATQGRFGNGQGQEFAEEFILQYWRPGAHGWITFKNRHGLEILEGNKNTYTVESRLLDPPILASKIRIVPHSLHVRTVCMRVELFGCPFKDGLISYSMPEGDHRRSELDLSDTIYDGFKDDSYLHGGLGQLTDSQKGDDDFRKESSSLGKGYEWVGWRNDTHLRTVEILFSFENVRNFTAMYLHTNNMFSRNAQVFSSAKMWFSVGGKHFGEPIHFTYLADLYNERARIVTIYLHHRLGRLLKVELTFAAKWILISEVNFQSVPAVGNVTEEDPPIAPPIVSRALSEGALSRQHVGLVIGLLAAVVLVLFLALFFLLARSKRKQDCSLTILKSPPPDLKVALEDSSGDKVLYQDPRDRKIPFSATYNSDMDNSGEYAVPDITKTVNPSPLLSTAMVKTRFPTTMPKSERFYATSDVVQPFRMQGVSGDNGVCGIPDLDILSNKEGPSAREIPRQRLRLIEKIRENQGSEPFHADTNMLPNEQITAVLPPRVASKCGYSPPTPYRQDRRIRHCTPAPGMLQNH